MVNITVNMKKVGIMHISFHTARTSLYLFLKIFTDVPPFRFIPIVC